MDLDPTCFAATRREITIQNGAKPLKLYAHELGYLAAVRLLGKVNSDPAAFAELIAESVTDANGTKFTVEQVLTLKREVAEPLFDLVLEVNGLADRKN